MRRCPNCEGPVGDDAEQCPSCGHRFAPESVDSPESVDPAESVDLAESIDSLGEEFVESLIGEEKLPQGKGTVGRFGIRCLRIALRLVFPRTDSRRFSIGFWGLRAIGLTVLASWAFFGLRVGVWDRTKLWSGLVTLFVGPLLLRLIQFVQEQFLFHGHTGQSWRDFWNFRRMMTPRSIQGAFFVGFWVLVVAGFVQVAGGFVDLVTTDRIRRSANDVFLTGDEIALPQDVIRTISPAIGLILRGNSSSTSSTLASPANDALSSLTIGQWRALSDRLVGNPTPNTHPLVKILRGLFLMVIGPLILRLTCESIILFFRVNETLTDISKQIEGAGRATERSELRVASSESRVKSDS